MKMPRLCSTLQLNVLGVSLSEMCSPRLAVLMKERSRGRASHAYLPRVSSLSEAAATSPPCLKLTLQATEVAHG